VKGSPQSSAGCMYRFWVCRVSRPPKPAMMQPGKQKYTEAEEVCTEVGKERDRGWSPSPNLPKPGDQVKMSGPGGEGQQFSDSKRWVLSTCPSFPRVSRQGKHG
jgi:hypothetical protein